MRNDDTDYTRKGKTYRADYMSSTKGLYGDIQDIPLKRTRKPKKPRSENPYLPSEYQIQCAVIDWARLQEGVLLISIPNAGKRSYWQGQKEVSMGLWRGASDLFLINSNKLYHGFFIELKRKGRYPTVEQYQFGDLVKHKGYQWDWYDDANTAIAAIALYLDT